MATPSSHPRGQTDAFGPGGLRRLHGPEWESDPMQIFDELRKEHGAVAPVLMPGDLPAWLVLGHRENQKVAGTPSVFSRDSRHWTAMRDGLVTPEHPLFPLTYWQPLVVFADGEEHARLRRAITESLARFEARGIRRIVERHAKDAIDAFVADGEVDLVEQYANIIPLKTVTTLFGMEGDYNEPLVHAARDMISGSATAAKSGEFVTRALDELVQRKKYRRGGDLPSVMFDHGLTEVEVREQLRLLMSASNEPTAQLICDSIAEFFGHPALRGRLSGGHLTLPEAMHEVLWNKPPMMINIGRWVTGDTELAGQRLRAGDMMLLGLAAGNFDPAARELQCPVRGNRSHLAFSVGPHECPGSTIGMGIAETAIDALQTHLPGLRLTLRPDELPRRASLMINKVVRMPAVFESAPRPRPQTAGPLPSVTTSTAPAVP
ncbi:MULTISPECIES: cytochrome P450 [Streptomyces]|uniref:Cytochrome P450 n=2 Tax=Streptomyces TaxID=1883 RepID=A0A4Y3R008_STRCI|nr:MULTISPECIES: cytochrome P450 [Streptomyces]NNG84120.1 cytochrome P450 [Streptomyces cacaoi]QHF93443.1 cytochrome P450 [Streptomyces sp. NHF165]GEB51006.1 cytochrome P450 [Streptomyces cacaoi]